MALIAAHLGVIEEDRIMDMSFDWFQEVLAVLGEVVNFTAVANYAGNSFCEKSWDMILDSNPMLKGQILNSADRALEAFFATAEYTEIGAEENGKEISPAWARNNVQRPGPVQR